MNAFVCMTHIHTYLETGCEYERSVRKRKRVKVADVYLESIAVSSV